MRHKTDGLTKKQKEVLDFIKQFHAENKYPPSIRQICSAINLSSPATVHVHINHLVDKGFIKRSKEGNRALELLVENEYDTRSDEVVNVPLLRKVTDGSTTNSIEMPDEFFSLPSCLVPDEKEVFVFKIKIL
jgi:repressor LexA